MSYPWDMTRLDLTLKMTGADGSERIERRTVEIRDHPDVGALHRAIHVLHTELRVIAGDQTLPRQNERARAWLKFSGKPASITRFFDIRNAQTMWLELSNLIIGAEADLALAQAFKALEPAQEPQFEDSVAINDLYFIHDRKMNLLNTAVWALICRWQHCLSKTVISVGGTNEKDWLHDQIIPHCRNEIELRRLGAYEPHEALTGNTCNAWYRLGRSHGRRYRP